MISRKHCTWSMTIVEDLENTRNCRVSKNPKAQKSHTLSGLNKLRRNINIKIHRKWIKFHCNILLMKL